MYTVSNHGTECTQIFFIFFVPVSNLCVSAAPKESRNQERKPPRCLQSPAHGNPLKVCKRVGDVIITSGNNIDRIELVMIIIIAYFVCMHFVCC